MEFFAGGVVESRVYRVVKILRRGVSDDVQGISRRYDEWTSAESA